MEVYQKIIFRMNVDNNTIEGIRVLVRIMTFLQILNYKYHITCYSKQANAHLTRKFLSLCFLSKTSSWISIAFPNGVGNDGSPLSKCVTVCIPTI